MRTKLLLAVALTLANASAYAQSANIETACSNNQFTLSANVAANTSCTYNEKLTINGIETFETLNFVGLFVREIPLQPGDQASVTSMFQCSSPNSSFSGTRSNSTADGCNAIANDAPPPTPDPLPQPPVDEFDPGALQEFQLELATILELAQDEVDNLESRAGRFTTISPRFANRIISRGIENLTIVTESRVDRALNLFVDRVEPAELLVALEQFEAEFALIIDVQ